MQWFRMYHEMINDTKIRRLARMCLLDNATIIGVWTIVLSLANESPERGRLLLAEGVRVMAEDISDIAAIEEDVIVEILDGMITLNMLEKNDDKVLSIVNWDKRQFKSDTSNDRVKRYRKKKKKENPDERNVTVTLQKRYSNAPETEADTETDTEVEGALDKIDELTTTPPPPSEIPLIQLYMNASGETGRKSDKWRAWFDDITGRYSREDCIRAFEALRSDIQAGRLNGHTKWERVIYHLENPQTAKQSAIKIPDFSEVNWMEESSS